MFQRYSNFLYNLSSKGKLPFELEVNESEVIVFVEFTLNFIHFFGTKETAVYMSPAIGQNNVLGLLDQCNAD